jgi:hypothetical protein
MGLLFDALYAYQTATLVYTGVGFRYLGDPLLPAGTSQVLVVTPGGDPTVCNLGNVTLGRGA